jgi:hypothetical protein
MRFFADPSIPATQVRWQWTDRPWVPFPDSFTSSNWYSEYDRGWPLGEDETRKRGWSNGAGPVAPGLPVGTTSQWAMGCGPPAGWLAALAVLNRLTVNMVFVAGPPAPTASDIIGATFTFRAGSTLPMGLKVMDKLEAKFVARSLLLVRTQIDLGVSCNFPHSFTFAMTLAQKQGISLTFHSISFLALALGELTRFSGTEEQLGLLTMSLLQDLGVLETYSSTALFAASWKSVLTDSEVYRSIASAVATQGQKQQVSLTVGSGRTVHYTTPKKSTFGIVTANFPFIPGSTSGGNGLPATVHANFSGGFGTCTSLSGTNVTLTYQTSTNNWVGTVASGTGSGTVVTLAFSGGAWKITGTGTCVWSSGAMTGPDGASPNLVTQPTITVCCTGASHIQVTRT